MYKIVTQLLNTFLEHLPIYFYVIDAKLNLLYIHNFQNDRWYVGNVKCHELIYHNDKPCHTCILPQMTNNTTSQKFLLQQLKTHHRRRPSTFEYTVVPLQISPDSPHFILFRNDVSEANKIMKQIHQLDMYAINDELSSGITHEAKNLINGIMGLLEEMDHSAKVEFAGVDLRANIARIRTELKTVSLLLGDLNSIGHTASSPKEAVILNKVIEDVLILMRKKFRDKQITINLESDAENITILANETSLKLLFLNLLLNAWQALPTAGKIKIRLKILGDIVQVILVDNGQGIAQDKISEIFAPFYTSKEERGGIGLGLTTSLMIAEVHGGYIDLISEPQQGTAAFVMLPRGSVDPCWKINTACDSESRTRCPVYQRGLVTHCWVYADKCPPEDKNCNQCEVFALKNRLPNLPPRPSTTELTLQSCLEA